MSYDLPPGPAPSGPPEHIDSVEGAPIRQGGGRRGLLAVVGAVAVVGVAGASWAAWSFFSTGPQPAEALPGSTLAYVSVDLDPSGGQKIEALRTLRKFPAFQEHVGLDTDDDIREWIFDRVQGDCDGLDYADDVEPWLGDRFGLAAVQVDGDRPAPVFVLQVSDEDGAEEGLAAIRACNGASPDEGAWVIRDGWVLLAETQEVVDQVADDAAQGSLSDDDDYRRWTDEVGDSGVIAMYAAPEAGTLLAGELAGGLAGELGGDTAGEMDCTIDAEGTTCSGLGADGTIPVPPEPEDMEQATEALKDFRGAAATIRFDGGGVELEVAADGSAVGTGLTSGDDAGEIASSLPADTVAALALSFGDGWGDELMDQVSQQLGASVDELVAEAESELGITLPDDAEAMVGDALALAIGPDFDAETLDSGPSALTGVGVKVLGDPAEVDGVLDKLRTVAGGADQGVLDSDTGDGAVAVGPDADYRAALLDAGGLGDSDAFGSVVDQTDGAAAILFVDLDAIDGWVADIAGDDQELRDNLEPLEALGLSAWQDDDTVHAVLKVTSD